MAMNEAARQVVVLVMLCASQAWGHGYVRDPPQRSSMWRYGYDTDANYNDTDANYNDMELNCGGFSNQWEKYGGKCGICGDSYGDPHPRENEAGGKYANGIITRTYKQGQVMDVTVELSANHQGYFLFKICPNNNVKVEATQECLDSNVLTFVDPNNGQNMGEKYNITGYNSGRKRVKLQLPSHVTCTQCVMQWTYYTGNRWGCNNANDTDCCVGCGPKQENFVNCVDIAITGDDNPPQTLAPPKTTPTPTPTPQQPTTTKTITVAPTQASTLRRNCRPVGVWKTKPGLDKWCAVNCAENNCPPDYCTCD